MIDYNHPKTVIFFSNPFGYGPTGTLLSVAKKFDGLLEKTQMILASSGLCNEILDKKQLRKFVFFKIDQRSYDEIADFLKRFKSPPLVVSSLNRFAVRVANDIGTESALIDCLGWFWQKDQRPTEYNLATYYFYNGLGQKKYPGNGSFDIPPITENKKTNTKENDDGSIVLHLGGTQSPFFSGIPKEYLEIVAKLINDTDFKGRVVIAGGSASMEYLKKLTGKKAICGSFPFDNFINKVSECRKVFTPAGMGVTFISLDLEKDLNIFLPHNLSQWALARTPLVKKYAHSIFSWEDYVSFDWESKQISEKDSMLAISNFSSEVLKHRFIYNKLQNKFAHFVSEPNKRIDPRSKIDTNGQDHIFKKLSAEWKLD